MIKIIVSKVMTLNPKTMRAHNNFDGFGHLLPVIPVIILGCVLLATATPHTTIESSPQFCSNIIVRFNPFVHLKDGKDSYDESYLLKMINLIAPKFSNILVPRIGVSDRNSSLALVTTAVAQYNKEYESAKENHLKVFMPFGGGWKPGTTNLTSFDVVLDVARRANGIFPETVEYLLVKPKGFGEATASQVMTELTTAKEKLEGIKDKDGFKLGGMFPLTACFNDGFNRENVSSHLYPFLDLLQLTVFSPEREDYSPEVEETVLHQTRQFDKCREIVKGLNPSISVGFRTSWPDTDVNGRKNLTSFKYFWREMNSWSWDTSTKLFMLEAFDIPVRSSNDKTKGWWRLLSRREGEDEFEEKWDGSVSTLPRSSSNTNKDTGNGKEETGSGTSVQTVVMVSVFASLLLLSLTGGAMFLMYKRVSRKIKNQPQMNYVSKSDIQEFFEGTGSVQNHRSSVIVATDTREGPDSLEDIVNSLNALAYNKDYELTRDAFKILEGAVLGSGQFGVVCKGKVLLGEDGVEVDAAVKMFKSGGPQTGFKGLLSETKLHSRLGKHENVVNLIGAYTAELKSGILYVFTELCEMGSMESYLRKSYPLRYSFPPRKNSKGEDEGNNGQRSVVSIYANRPKNPNGSEGGNFADAKQLYRWSYEIACGMEYLTSRKVVHADLASRNVLLTNELTAKISDFGLSRRLYDYSSYVKSNQEPLPWPWMAPESLRRMEFNEKTDVWSYGITLWEIYSLGDRPYPGLTWTWDLANKLCSGMRPGEPQYNMDNMYTTMLKCWHTDPAKRPTFLDLKGSFRFSVE